MLVERDGRLFVQGAMTMVQAAALLAAGESRCAAADWIIDLVEVEQADSSALAVVLAWLRSAKASGRCLQIANPPLAFSSLSVLYGVDGLLAAFLHGGSDRVSDARA